MLDRKHMMLGRGYMFIVMMILFMVVVVGEGRGSRFIADVVVKNATREMNELKEAMRDISLEKKEDRKREDRKKEREYKIESGGLRLGEILFNVFKGGWNVIFDKDVDVDSVVIGKFRGKDLVELCNQIAESVGYYCERDGVNVYVRKWYEAILDLHGITEEMQFMLGLGGSLTGGGGQGGGQGAGQGGGQSVTSTEKVEMQFTFKRQEFEEFLKSFLSEEGVLKIDWNGKNVYVRDVKRNVRALKHYLEFLRKKVSESLYVEARVFLFQKEKKDESGINLKAINLGDFALELLTGLTSPLFNLRYKGNKVEAILSFFHSLGHVEEIISPRIRTLNNVPAQIIRGSSKPYVVFNTVTNVGGGVGGGTVQATPEVNFVFDGVSLVVHPYIVGEEIYLTIKPLVSAVEGYQQFSDGFGGVIKIPQVSVSSQLTKIKLMNNETVIMGGLIWDGKSRVISGIPFLSQIPILGRLFSSRLDSKKETYLILAIYARKD